MTEPTRWDFSLVDDRQLLEAVARHLDDHRELTKQLDEARHEVARLERAQAGAFASLAVCLDEQQRRGRYD